MLHVSGLQFCHLSNGDDVSTVEIWWAEGYSSVLCWDSGSGFLESVGLTADLIGSGSPALAAPGRAGGASLHSALTLGTFLADPQKDKHMLPISKSARRRFVLFHRAYKQVRLAAGTQPTQQKQASLKCHRGVPQRHNADLNAGASSGLVPDLPDLGGRHVYLQK